MKKRIFTLMMLLMAIRFAAEANPVDLQSACEAVAKFVNTDTRMRVGGENDLQLVTSYRTADNTKALRVFKTGNGVVITPANDCATPILTYSDEGRSTYQITAVANPSESGTISGGGTYYEGDLCTLTAASYNDYDFVNWTKDGVEVSTDPAYSFTVTEDATYTANFELFNGLTVGDGSTSTNYYLPSYSFYCHSLSQQIYTPNDIEWAGAILSLGFYNDGGTKTQSYDIYMVNTDKTSFTSNYDWIPVTEEDLVFSGSVTMISGGWTTIPLENQFVYDGISNLAIIVDNNTGSYTGSPHMACRVFGTEEVQAIRVYSDGTNYDPYNPSNYSGTLYTEKNQIRLSFDMISMEPIVIPDTLAMSYRPNNAWMSPYKFQIYNPGNYSLINSISTDNPYFQLEEVSLPFVLGHHKSRGISITHGSGSGEMTGHLIINYGDNQTVQFDLSAIAYDPAIKDVWETAYEVTSFPYTDSLIVADIPLYNNYNLPPTDTEDGADAVYKLVFDQDALLNASMTSGENGKMILYREGFEGEGGPWESNCYTGPLNDEFSESFETQLGEGTSTFRYFPFYTYYDNSIAENLFLADELIAAGMKKSRLQSLSWYATNSPGYFQQNISIWLANVTETDLSTGTSHLTSDMTLVYTGSCTPQIGWNEFEFNESSFVWDGISNLLICVQRNNGSWNTSVTWQSHTTSFYSSAYTYRDGTYYDMQNTTYGMNTTSSRPNIIFKGGYSAGSSVIDLTMATGTYYLVTSSTSDAWGIEINTDVLSCPELASHPTPSDYDTDVIPTAVALHWEMGERTTEYMLLLGTEYDYLDTIMDWTRNLTESYVVTGLLNNANYFWQIKERNDGCPEGAEGPIWGFTTLLNGPQDLYAASYNIFEGDDAYLEWTPLADTNILSYNIYQDNVLIGNTTTNNYTVSGLIYNMEGYNFHVTAVYAGGESNASNAATVWVSGNGSVAGHVYEQDGTTGIENATVTFIGNNEFGYSNTFTFTTDADGYYTGSLKAGTFTALATCNGYQASHYNGTVSITYSETTEDIDIVMDEVFYPVAEVVAEYYPDATDPNSPYVKVYWDNNATNWLYYDDGINQDAIGLNGGGSFYWGIMFPAGSYSGNKITKVSMYDYAAHTGNIMVFQGGATAPSSLLYTQAYSCTGSGDFVEWTLNTPVFIDPSLPLWIVMNNNDGQYIASCCANTGDPNGRWISLGGTEWNDLAGYGLDYTWMLRAYVTGSQGSSTMLAYPSPNNQNMSFGNVSMGGNRDASFVTDPDATPHFVGTPADANRNSRSFNHYRVYRTNAYNVGPYTEDNTVLLADNVTDTLLIDVTWQDAEAGVYKFGVSRVYEGNRESEIRWGELQQNIKPNAMMNREPIYPLEECSAGLAPIINVPENTDLPIFRGDQTDCLIVQNGSTFSHFILSDPTNVVSYGYNINEFTQGACYMDGTYYFSNSSGTFGVFSPEYGLTEIAIGVPYGQTIEYNPIDGKMYGTNTSGELYEVNPHDGSYSFITNLSTSFLLTFTITNEGRFILCDGGDECIKEYDPVTGNVNPLIYVDWNINYGQDMAMDRETNEVYWAAYNASDGTHPLIKLDLDAGTLTTIGYFTNQASAFANKTTISNPIQGERESAIVWSNPMDKSMYLGNGDVNVTVTLNSGDSPEGVLVQLTNLNPTEQALYPVADITLDGTGYYAFDSFRKGEYQVQVSFNDYSTITEEVSIWDATALAYMLNEINYAVSNLYVSRTGWATWNDDYHCNSVPSLDVDTVPAKGNRHFNNYQVELSDTEENVIYQGTLSDCFMQLPTDNLIDGEIYHLKVAAVYSSGLSEWQEIDWAYQSCDNFETVAELNMDMNDDANVISWTYPIVEERSIMTGSYPAYACRLYNGDNSNNPTGWFSFDVESPEINNLISTNPYFYGGDYCPLDGYVHATDYNYNWFVMDPETGNILDQGSLNVYFRDCAWDYTTDMMYGISGSYLYSWDVENNTTTQIGYIGFTGQILACDLDGQLYAISSSDGNLYRINKETGASTYVGYTGQYTYYVQSGGFDHYSGKLYWTGYGNNGFFAEVDTETGQATVLATNTGEVLSFCVPFNGTNYVSPVTGVLGAMVYRDEELLGFTTNNTYIDSIATGNHEYAIRVVYDGMKRCPNFNAYYAMSCPLTIGGASYEVTVSANPVQGGVTTGSGTYINGFPCTVTATANENYIFTNWVMDGEVVANTPEYTFRVTDNTSMEANFIGFTPHWEVVNNPEYSPLSMIGIVNVNGEEQTGNYMEVAALCGNECRGRQMLTYYPDQNRFFVFMTIYGQDGDDITFSLYNHEQGEETEYSCLSHLTFDSEVTVGSYNDPYAILFGIIQTTAMQTGWNWYSTIVEQEGIEGLEMLEASLGFNGVMIKSQTDGFDINYNNLWMGNLDFITNDQMYMINTNAPIEAVVSGFSTNVNDHPITLYTGWTWVGYPHTEALDINDALANLNATNGDILKSKQTFSTYIEGQGWYGTLNTLEPSIGMMYHSKKNSNTTFTYSDAPGRMELTPNLTTENNHWMPNDFEYPDNMSVMAVVELNHVELADGDYELAAFENGKCLGSAKLIYVGPTNRYMAFLTLSGEEDHVLSFSLYDAETGVAYTSTTETVVFTPNAIVGSLDEPFIVHFDEATGINQYDVTMTIHPNPADRGSLFSIAMSTNKSETAMVEIINALGEVVSVTSSSQSPMMVKAPNVTGIYMVRVIINGKESYSRKLIVK